MRPGTYDRMMRGSHQRRYYGDSGYFNFGYWGAGLHLPGNECDQTGFSSQPF